MTRHRRTPLAEPARKSRPARWWWRRARGTWALSLIHIYLALLKDAGHFQKPVRQSALAVVNMGDDAKVANMGKPVLVQRNPSKLAEYNLLIISEFFQKSNWETSTRTWSGSGPLTLVISPFKIRLRLFVILNGPDNELDVDVYKRQILTC